MVFLCFFLSLSTFLLYRCLGLKLKSDEPFLLRLRGHNWSLGVSAAPCLSDLPFPAPKKQLLCSDFIMRCCCLVFGRSCFYSVAPLLVLRCWWYRQAIVLLRHSENIVFPSEKCTFLCKTAFASFFFCLAFCCPGADVSLSMFPRALF